MPEPLLGDSRPEASALDRNLYFAHVSPFQILIQDINILLNGYLNILKRFQFRLAL